MNEPRIYADFADGESGAVRRVTVAIVDNDRLRIGLPEADPVDWPLVDLRSIPDQADRKSVVLGLAGDHPARLVVRDAKFARHLDELSPDLKRPNKTPNLARKLTIFGGAALASVALIIFVLIPVMADQMAKMLPPEGERALGETTLNQIRTALGQDRGDLIRTCKQPNGLAALQKMNDRLTPGTDFPYDLRVIVLDHEMVNAFALPGGHIILFEGLLRDAESAEEVAGVLGHEMGHVAHRDPTRLALRSAGSIGVLGLLFGDFAGGAVILFLTERLIQAQYSQGAESASDAYAHELLNNAGLPTTPMSRFFVRLLEEYGKDESLLSHLSSHPDLQERANRAVEASTVRGVYDPVLTSAEWQALRNICN